MLLKGKVALITGSARGIGRASALVLAREGADVGVADIRPEVEDTAEAIVRSGRRSASVAMDISDPDQVEKGVAEIRQQLGDVDILVNNAGIVKNIAPLARMTIEAWQNEISINLSGAYYMIRQVIGPMVEKKWGRIVNISSIAAKGGLRNQIGYASTKAALLGLTQTVTLEHARDGITCNAILPGLIRTELVNAMPEEIRRNIILGTPAHRAGETEEVGHLIAFLASENAGFINGTVIPIDGGATLNTSSVGSRKEASELSNTKNS